MATRGPYAKGLAKREEILDAAVELYARDGYDRTSVREIARATGLSQAGLLHHFSGKEELFAEVLRRRDAVAEARYNADAGAPVSVEGLISTVSHNLEEPQLVQLFVTMSSESMDPASPGHSFFAERYKRLVGDVTEDMRRLQEAGQLSRALAPEAMASLLIAAADGLQIQWLLNPAGLDMGERLTELWEAMKQVR
ncbi:TetR/AcrR family transcriptional regulator [Cellulomonas hominis]|uniref:TetR/AcrR family transcriptional regulator n=1 Tax=Cellulomonas hominis TaxID=156981 RepID=UPI0014441967|nr:TetR/AcrR family transcriptional regulator [Cellulomonas hominis]NKY10424.1 TetR/AcrR family transcriptional regulator [Cellulomonas hominis]